MKSKINLLLSQLTKSILQWLGFRFHPLFSNKKQITFKLYRLTRFTVGVGVGVTVQNNLPRHSISASNASTRNIVNEKVGDMKMKIQIIAVDQRSIRADSVSSFNCYC